MADVYPLKKTPEILSWLDDLIEGEVAGDPMSGQQWLRRDLRYLSRALQASGASVSHMTVRRLLKQQGYSLKANRKEHSPSSLERDRQFRYIERVKRLFVRAGHPIISVDAKKKELIGNFKNPGRSWQHATEEVDVHDFPSSGIIRATPYGIYDVCHNLGYVYVGISADTAEFAVDAISRWWQRQDRPQFTDESKLLILCDSGGSNGYRTRNWKKQLQEILADPFQIEVMVCHYPTGTSKWNPIEHRLFSFISLNWAGVPLRSLKIILNLIRGTTTDTGLKVQAALIRRHYATKVKVSDQEMAMLNLSRRSICPQWNYILRPRAKTDSKV
ncbi:ISAzo13 family transposase [Leptothoe sp. PORK10 BA2]|uniref:ISAzo13 family transposase n=1 Tax=Leptothoe sp. PORK10 BA2 TaxID=3110254 RepID=UPI002B20538D|nr:ISAzo13 family transposase [Leptothoe sp. PORK10 BA2]MEA5464910.1 ISAzo13 family transposase [Leptothoe sp. PORK10 BA2]